MKIYAMSDIHGCLKEFEYALSLIDLSTDNRLILLGDYIHGKDNYRVLDRIISLQKEYRAEKIIALLGNHEDMVLDGICSINDDDIFRDGSYYSLFAGLDTNFVEFCIKESIYYVSKNKNNHFNSYNCNIGCRICYK